MKKSFSFLSFIGPSGFLGIFAAGYCAQVFAGVTLDTGFNPPLSAPVSSGYALATIAGDGTYFFQNADTGKLVKVSSTGVVDTGYNPPLSTHFGESSGFFDANPLPGNALLLTGNFNLNGNPALAAKLLPNGAVDPAFTPVTSPAGRTYSVTSFTQANGDLLLNHTGYDQALMSSTGGVKVVRPNGQVVAGFPPPGPLSSAMIQDDGKLLVTGYPLQVDGQSRLFARYGTDYQRDTGFNAPAFIYKEGADFWFRVRDFSWGYLLSLEALEGSDVTLNGLPAKRLYRLQINGTLASSFAPWSPPIPVDAYLSTYIDDVSVDASGNGRILMKSEEYGGALTAIRKFHILDASSGAVDTSFNPTVLTGSSSYVSGEFVAGGVRLSVEDATQVNGQAVPPNASFALLGATGAVTSYELTPMPLIEGRDFSNPNGPRVPVSYINKQKLSDGSTLITATYPEFTHVNGQPMSGILRVKADGNLDTDFALVPGDPAGFFFRVNVEVYEEEDRQLLLTGNFRSVNGVPRPGVARVTIGSDGSPAEWTDAYTISSDPATLSSTDSDKDGVLDLLELAFRLHPRQVDGSTFTASSGRGLPAATLHPGNGAVDPKLRLTFPRRRDRVALGLTYQPLFSSSLSEAGTVGVEISATPADATWEIVVVEDPGTPGGVGRRFARVRVGL